MSGWSLFAQILTLAFLWFGIVGLYALMMFDEKIRFGRHFVALSVICQLTAISIWLNQLLGNLPK